MKKLSFSLLLTAALLMYAQYLSAQEHQESGTSPFPSFSYPDSSGHQFSLNDIRGKKATLVIFWASWCAPCRKEIPALKTLLQENKGKGISFVSISVDQNISAWKKALREEKMSWTNLANLPAAGSPVMELFGINAVPAMYLLDKDNHIVLSDPDFKDLQLKIKSM